MNAAFHDSIMSSYQKKKFGSQREQDFRFILVDIRLPVGNFITECFCLMIFKL